MKFLSLAMAALLTSSAALAQPGPMMGGGQGPMSGDMPMMGMMGGHCAMMGRTEGALAFLKAELEITTAQENAWGAFAATYRDGAAHMPMGPRRGGPSAMKGKGGRMMGMSGGPFPDVAAQRLLMMEQHLANARKLTDAAKPLYDALSAEQKKTADELLPHFVMMRCPMQSVDQ